MPEYDEMNVEPENAPEDGKNHEPEANPKHETDGEQRKWIWRVLSPILKKSPDRIGYSAVIKNRIKATLGWLKQKVKSKLQNKKNGQVLLSSIGEVKNVVLETIAKRKDNLRSLEELHEALETTQKLEQEGFQLMMVDIDAYGNIGTWEAIFDEDENVRTLRGKEGYTVITQ